jgi:hypothetical protein
MSFSYLSKQSIHFGPFQIFVKKLIFLLRVVSPTPKLDHHFPPHPPTRTRARKHMHVSAQNVCVCSYPPHLDIISIHNLKVCSAVLTRDSPNMGHFKINSICSETLTVMMTFVTLSSYKVLFHLHEHISWESAFNVYHSARCTMNAKLITGPTFYTETTTSIKHISHIIKLCLLLNENEQLYRWHLQDSAAAQSVNTSVTTLERLKE